MGLHAPYGSSPHEGRRTLIRTHPLPRSAHCARQRVRLPVKQPPLASHTDVHPVGHGGASPPTFTTHPTRAPYGTRASVVGDTVAACTPASAPRNGRSTEPLDTRLPPARLGFSVSTPASLAQRACDDFGPGSGLVAVCPQIPAGAGFETPGGSARTCNASSTRHRPRVLRRVDPTSMEAPWSRCAPIPRVGVRPSNVLSSPRRPGVSLVPHRASLSRIGVSPLPGDVSGLPVTLATLRGQDQHYLHALIDASDPPRASCCGVCHREPFS